MAAPRFRDLDQSECRALLAGEHVGRLAFHDGRRVDIEPLSYVHLGDWIFGRTQEGTKVWALRHAPYVAFETDRARGPFEWKSVVAHGTIYFLPGNGAPIEDREYERAVAALRRIIPETLGADDPVPHRNVVFGLHIDALSGRAAEPGTPTRSTGGARRAGPKQGATRGKAGRGKRAAAKRPPKKGKRRG